MVSDPGQGASPGARCAAAPGPADASPGAAAWAMLCWEARPAGRWAVPEGAREGRTPPIGVSNNANDPAGVTDPHPSIPTSNRGRAAGRRTMGLRRQGAALARNAWGWRATETVLAPPGRAWRDPVALLIAARAVCRFCCRTIGRTWGSLDDPEVPVNSADIPGRSRDRRNRHRSRRHTRRDRMEAGQTGRRYDPRSVLGS